MATVKMLNMAGEAVGEIELKDDIFGIEINENAVYTVVKNYLANQRQGFLPPPLTSLLVLADCVPCLWFAR